MMDLFRHLIWVFIKIAIAFFTVAIIWWIISTFFPAINFRTLMPINFFRGGMATSTVKTPKEDFLPSPKQFSSLFGKPVVPTPTTNVFVAQAPYNSYGINNSQYKYSTYSYSQYSNSNDENFSSDYTGSTVGTTNTSAKKSDEVITNTPSTVSSTDTRTLTIRNLSIYEGSYIYSGLTFIGEAKSSMFRDGKFPIVIIDKSGKALGVVTAVAQSDWTVAGWTRFQTRINFALPTNVPCTVIFEEALTQAEKTRQPVRIPLFMTCK